MWVVKRATFVLQQCCKTSCTSLRPFLPYLKVYLSFVDSISCLSQSRCLVLPWRNYYNSQLIRGMLNLTFPERPCLEWVRLCRDCTRPFWPRMAELILSWENIIVVVLHLFIYIRRLIRESRHQTSQIRCLITEISHQTSHIRHLSDTWTEIWDRTSDIRHLLS